MCFNLFLIYGGLLLEINSVIAYGEPSFLTKLLVSLLGAVGFGLLPGLLVHFNLVYMRSVSRRSLSPFLSLVALIFYAAPIVYAVVRTSLSPPWSLLPWLETGGMEVLPFAILVCIGFEMSIVRASVHAVERSFFRSLIALSAVIVLALAYCVGLAWMGLGSGAASWVAIALGVLPGALLLYYLVRRNFLEFGAQRNLIYALPVTFLALLYLALVRRLSGWLEPVLPPEATAAVLLFSLIFLFEPLERVIGPVLQQKFQEGMGGVQRLSIALQQEARHGQVARLVAEAESRIRREYGLAEVRISIPRDATAKPLAAPGGLGHTAAVRLIKDGQEIGLLEAASTGSYLTGETTAALGFLGEQLPGMIDLARLIEDKVRLERELAERERMASLGQMAANVSHNLRNPLSSMKTVLQVQLENPDLPVDVRRDSTLVVNEIDRMSAKLSQLLRYAKPAVSGQRVAAVALANQTAVLFRHDAERRNVRFEFERPTEEIYALASEEALSEILSNLIVNAIEAQGTGGRVKVGLARSEGRLEIIVEDGGPGISQELREKMFQPYFTTKPAGTGLGLSIVARRVEEMAGTISCESPVRNGKGTRFRLTLPLATGEGN